jgi:CHASE2 domain-containing sensor protein
MTISPTLFLYFYETDTVTAYQPVEELINSGQLDERPIPTLTEWGMIIFCALLFGWMAWVIVRRRRRVTIGV